MNAAASKPTTNLEGREAKLASLQKGLEVLAPVIKDTCFMWEKSDRGLLLGEWNGFRTGFTDKLQFRLFCDGILGTEIQKIPSRRVGDATCGEKKGLVTLRTPREFVDYIRSDVPQDLFDRICLNVATELDRVLAMQVNDIGAISRVLRT